MSSQTRIIIVDDDPLIRNIYQNKFEKADCEVMVLPNAENNFIEEIKNFKPHLIVLDEILCQPTEDCIDGFKAFEMLKEDKETQNIPVIFLTNQFEEEQIKKAKKVGILSYFIKAENTPAQVVQKILEKIGIKNVNSNLHR